MKDFYRTPVFIKKIICQTLLLSQMYYFENLVRELLIENSLNILIL